MIVGKISCGGTENVVQNKEASNIEVSILIIYLFIILYMTCAPSAMGVAARSFYFCSLVLSSACGEMSHSAVMPVGAALSTPEGRVVSFTH